MKLNEYGRTILFDLEKHHKKQTTHFRFNSMKFILLQDFLVEGHTDSDGSNEMNQTLSENRAAALKII
jgi:outer membrane protein OmpA-like peptidoglycan-associated protein